MKITDWAIVFLLIFLPTSLAIDISQHRQIEALSFKQMYNETMYTASEDATNALLDNQGDEAQGAFSQGTYKSSKDVEPNLNKAIARYYETVYLNLGIDDDKVAQDALKANLPLAMVVGYDGLYSYSWQNVYNSDTAQYEVKEIWMPKIPYAYYDGINNLVLNFTLDDYSYVYNNVTGDKDADKRADLISKYPTEVFMSPEIFENVRKQTIIDIIRNQLEYYTNRNNFLSTRYGKSYIYNIPIVSDETWSNTINDICFISFLQGIVIPGTNESYSTFGFGGTKLKLTNKYCGNTISGLKYYHKEGCNLLSVAEGTFNDKKEAAKAGYMPCSVCVP